MVVSLETATFTAPPDTRDLGIMVDWLRLEPDGTAPVIPPPLMLAGFLLAIALFFLACLRLGGPVRSGLLGGLVLALPLVAALAVDPLFVAYYGPWLLLALAALALAGQRARRASWWEWLALVALGWSLYRFGVRALDFYRTGLPPGDFTIYFDAAKGLRQGQPLYNWEAARQMPNGPVYKYPPLFAMLLAPLTVFATRPVAAGWYLLNLGLLVLIIWGLIWRFRCDLGTRSPKLFSAYGFLLVIGFLNFQPAWESLAVWADGRDHSRRHGRGLVLAAPSGRRSLGRRPVGFRDDAEAVSRPVGGLPLVATPLAGPGRLRRGLCPPDRALRAGCRLGHALALRGRDPYRSDCRGALAGEPVF